MKNYYIVKQAFFFSLLFVFVACNLTETNKQNTIDTHQGYTIKGYTNQSYDSIFLLDKDSLVINKSKITNGAFLLKGTTSPQASFAFVTFDAKMPLHSFIIENEAYNALFSKNNWMILGGDLNSKLAYFEANKTNLLAQKAKYYAQYKADHILAPKYYKLRDSIDNIATNNLFKFIEDNNTNILSLYAVKQTTWPIGNLNTLQTALNDSPNNELKQYISSLKKKIKKIEKKEKINRREVAPDFSGTNLNGRITSLDDVKKNKKAVLIDFWASWCGPCRRLTPTVRSLYNQYKDKGFDILTVSEDRSIDAWQNGVREDKMDSWNHIYDENGYVAASYGVRGIPHMVLLDDKGRIIKNKISITELKAQLKDIFK
ncbi:TlpA family protein disulfide reductase [Tenacibaculum sp. UWU-22]|uniref:TlpA family protein disulfide reductase n=1 Tax=Tenacibaculum sp. UWU-22 TaxID=3234187 RepID=UPI0034DAD99D